MPEARCVLGCGRGDRILHEAAVLAGVPVAGACNGRESCQQVAAAPPAASSSRQATACQSKFPPRGDVGRRAERHEIFGQAGPRPPLALAYTAAPVNATAMVRMAAAVAIAVLRLPSHATPLDKDVKDGMLSNSVLLPTSH